MMYTSENYPIDKEVEDKVINQYLKPYNYELDD